MSYSTDYIGKPTNRVDGPAKVAGTAKYAAEFSVPNLLYGYVVSSPIAKGRITKIDSAPVLALPGVQQVFSHENVPTLALLDRSYKETRLLPAARPSARCTMPILSTACNRWRWWWPTRLSSPATPPPSCTLSMKKNRTKLS